MNVIAALIAGCMFVKWIAASNDFEIRNIELLGKVISLVSIVLMVIAIVFGITTMYEPKINSSEGGFGVPFIYFFVGIVLIAPLILGLFLSKFKSRAVYISAALIAVIIELATIYILNFLRIVH